MIPHKPGKTYSSSQAKGARATLSLLLEVSRDQLILSSISGCPSHGNTGQNMEVDG